MWSDIKLYYTNRAVEIILAFLAAAFIYGVAALGDYLVYITSRYVFQSGNWYAHCLMYWRTLAFAVVFVWAYRGLRNL